jgi:aldose sugar dehydrogenase
MRTNRGALLAVLGIGALLIALAVGALRGSADLGQKAEPDTRPTLGRAATPALIGTPRPRATEPVASVSAVAVPVTSDVVAVALPKEQKLALLDLAAGKVARTIDIGVSAGSVALAPDRQMVWLIGSKPGDNAISTVDLNKGERRDSRHLKEGAGPSAVAFSSDGSRAYVAQNGGNDSPPDPSTVAFLNMSGGQIGQVEVGRQTRGVQIHRRLDSLAVQPAPGGDVLYVAAEASGAVFALDGGSGALLDQIETGGGPLALISDTARQRLYVLVDTLNQLVAIDTSTRSVAARLDLPGPPAAGIVATDGTLFVVGGDDDGQLWVIGPELKEITAKVSVGDHPSGLATNSNGDQLYVTSAANGGTLAVVNRSPLSVTQNVKLPDQPSGVVVGRSGTRSPSPLPSPKPAATPTLVPTPTALPEGAQPPEHMASGAQIEPFLANAAVPVSMVFAPDGRLFYSELHTGRIRVVQNGELLDDPFYRFAVAGQPETGLLGLAIDPDFANNHYLYAFYTSVAGGASESGGANGPNEVVRLTDVNNQGTNLTTILELPSGPIHNAGTLRFGPDGKLYISLGDNDQGSNAQDLGSIAGKILRVNPDGSIPADNPFAGQTGKQGAIWAYGLRNPYSFAFHPQGHQLLVTENGPGDNDELDVIVKGANYGWPPTGYKYKPGIVDPIAVMNPPIGPTGMTFYMGSQMPDWTNDLFYCNYHMAQLRRVHLAPVTFDRVVFEEVVKQGCALDVATGPDGALYYTDSKGIYRIRMPGAQVLPAVQSAPAGATAAPTDVVAAGTHPEDRDINITLSEWRLSPSRSRVPAGRVRLVSENTGATPHALRITGGGLDVSTESFVGGQSRTLDMVLPAGTYQLVCPLPGHEQQGMSATITVVAP